MVRSIPRLLVAGRNSAYSTHGIYGRMVAQRPLTWMMGGDGGFEGRGGCRNQERVEKARKGNANADANGNGSRNGRGAVGLRGWELKAISGFDVALLASVLRRCAHTQAISFG